MMISRSSIWTIILLSSVGCIQTATASVITSIDIAPQVNSAFAMIALGFVVVAGVVILKILSSWH
jgi:hypothetical protein